MLLLVTLMMGLLIASVAYASRGGGSKGGGGGSTKGDFDDIELPDWMKNFGGDSSEEDAGEGDAEDESLEETIDGYLEDQYTTDDVMGDE